MAWLEEGQGIIQGGKSIRLDSRRVPEPLDTGGGVECQNPASEVGVWSAKIQPHIAQTRIPWWV